MSDLSEATFILAIATTVFTGLIAVTATISVIFVWRRKERIGDQVASWAMRDSVEKIPSGKFDVDTAIVLKEDDTLDTYGELEVGVFYITQMTGKTGATVMASGRYVPSDGSSVIYASKGDTFPPSSKGNVVTWTRNS